MATKLYDKEGNPRFFPAKRVKLMLGNGWFVEPPKKAKVKKAESVTIEEEPVDFMAGLSEEEIRAKAKDAGIQNYWNKNLDSLKEELGL